MLRLLLAAAAAAAAAAKPDTMACCRGQDVGETCARLLCDIEKPPSHMQVFSSAFKNCSRHLPAIAACLADGRNHLGCCEAEAERPESACFDLCEGAAPVGALDTGRMEDARYVSYMSCLAFNVDTIYKCFRNGYDRTPSPPLRLVAESVGEEEARLHWDSPEKWSELVDKFHVYYEASSPSPSAAWDSRPVLVAMERLSTRRRSKTLKGLCPNTRYAVYAVAAAADDRRRSLPSDVATFLTKGVGPTVEAFPKEAVISSRGPSQILVCKVALMGLEAPQLQVAWSKAGPDGTLAVLSHSEDPSSSPKYAQTAYQAALDPATHRRTVVVTLTINDSGPGDLGTYACSVDNSFGVAAAEVRLGPPSALLVPAAPPLTDHCGLGGRPDATALLSGPADPVAGIRRLLACTLAGKAEAGCCLRRQVPERCLGLCDGSVSGRVELQLYFCLAFASAVFACDLEAKAALPPAPRRLSARPEGSGLRLSWAADEGAAAFYVYSQAQSGGPWSRRRVTGARSVFVASPPPEATFVVVAEAAGGLSGPSRQLFWPARKVASHSLRGPIGSPEKLLVAGRMYNKKKPE